MAKKKLKKKARAIVNKSKSSERKADVQNMPNVKTSEKEFLAICGLHASQLKSAEIEWGELAAIFEAHVEELDQLEEIGSYVSRTLRKAHGVHSVRLRIKDPRHLVAKIIKKRQETNTKSPSYDDFKTSITDRIGIRALHLFKHDWPPIHEFIIENWEQFEEPVAYYRSGDDQTIIDQFIERSCRVEAHPLSYRSIHYLIKTAPGKTIIPVEIQVRTLFEEAWSEIDHKLNYPTPSSDPIVTTCLQVFNRVAGSADELGTFLDALSKRISQFQTDNKEIEREKNSIVSELEEMSKKYNLSESERKELLEKIDELQKQKGASVFSLSGVDSPSLDSITQALFPPASQYTFPVLSGTAPILSALITGLSTDKKVCKKCGKPTSQFGDVKNWCFSCEASGD